MIHLWNKGRTQRPQNTLKINKITVLTKAKRGEKCILRMCWVGQNFQVFSLMNSSDSFKLCLWSILKMENWVKYQNQWKWNWKLLHSFVLLLANDNKIGFVNLKAKGPESPWQCTVVTAAACQVNESMLRFSHWSFCMVCWGSPITSRH